MEINDRLRQIRVEMNLSQAEFALKFGIPQSTYAKYEKAGRSVPYELMQALGNIGINIHWLVTGFGPEKIDNSNQDTFISSSGKTYPVILGNSTYSVPILASKVSAGPGCEWSQSDFRELRMPTLEKFFLGYPKDDIFAAEVVGDSMQDIDLIDGDFVFACHNLVRGNGIYVMALDTEVIVKRLEIDTVERKLRIISKNSDYPDKVVDPDRVIILGKVIGWLHRYAN